MKVFAFVVATTTALLVVPPTWSIIRGGFLEGSPFEPGDLTLENFRAVFASSTQFRVLANTAILGVSVTLLSVLIGTLLAWLVHRSDLRGRSAIDVLLVAALFLPSFLAAIAWTFIGDPANGLLARTLGVHWSIYSLAGVAIVMALYSTPIAYLVVGSALQTGDGSLEEVAATTGSRALRTFTRISLPLIAPAILSSTLLVFARTVGEFGIPAVIGIPGRVQVAMTEIYVDNIYSLPKYGESSAIAALILGVSLAVVLLQTRVAGNAGQFQVVSGKYGSRSRVHLRSRGQLLGLSFAWTYLAATVIVPYAVLFLQSLQPYWTYDVDSFSLSNFKAVFTFPSVTQAISNSLLLGTLGAVVCALLGSGVAYVAGRARFRGRVLPEILSTTAAAIPPVLVSLSLLFMWVGTPLFGTLLIFLAAYVIHNVPYAVRTSRSGLLQVSRDLEDVASLCGAGFGRRIVTIVIPLLSRSLVASGILVFVFIVREMGPVILLRGSSTDVLPTITFILFEQGQYNTVAALAAVMAAIILAALFAMRLFVGVAVRRLV